MPKRQRRKSKPHTPTQPLVPGVVVVIVSASERPRAKATVDAGQADAYVWAIDKSNIEGYVATLEGEEILKSWLAYHYPNLKITAQRFGEGEVC
jgi:hypothetical protein